jgi:hypothetical protein
VQEILSRPKVAGRNGGLSGPLLWAIAGFALYLLGGAGSILVTAIVADPVLEAAGFRVEAGELGLSVRNALQPLVWGGLVAAVSVPVGRRLIDSIRFSLGGWVILGSGLLLASVTWFLGQEFVRARFGYFDPGGVGVSFFAWPALVAVALCGWAVLAVRRGAAAPLVILLVLAAIGLAIALLPSVAGASDGVDAASVPLALTFLVDVAYAILLLMLAFRGFSSIVPG